MSKRLSSKDFYEVYSKVPRLCVDLVVQNKDGILFTLRNIPPALRFWHLPGGTVLYKESLEEAVRRIAKEELGIEIRIIKNLGAIEYLDDKTTIFGHSISVAFLVTLKEGRIKLDNQSSEFKFFKKIPEKTLKEQKAFLKRNF